MRTDTEAAAHARPVSAFSNDGEYQRWRGNWCDRCIHDSAAVSVFTGGDVPRHPNAPEDGCPLVTLILTGHTPAEFLPQPEDSPDQYHCVEFRAEGDDGLGHEPQPHPPPPDMDSLFPEPARARRMLTPYTPDKAAAPKTTTSAP